MKKDFNAVIRMHTEGYTLEEIAESTGKSRAAIARWIEQHKASLKLAGIPEEDEEEYFDEPTEITGLSGLEKANKLKERELKTLDQKAKVESEKIKRTTLREFKRVISGIRSYARGFKWKHSDVTETLDKIENLEEQAHEALAFNENEIEKNSISQILNILKREFSKLVESGESFSFTFNFTDYEMELLDNALSLEEFDNDEFDVEDYHRQGAWQKFVSLIDKFHELSGTSVGREDIQKCQESIRHFNEVIGELPEGITSEFDEELEVLESVSQYLKELSIRIDESIWNSKRFLLSEEVTDQINVLIENEGEPKDE